jgi:carboxyl-terminal processing protease
MNRWNLAWLIGIPMVVMLGLTVSYSAPISREHEQDYELIKLVADVLTEVDRNYVRELDTKGRRQLVEDMIAGGLERLDPHSTYLNHHEVGNFNRRSHGRFGGVGISVSRDRLFGGLFVTSPMVGTPAYEAGIQPGDYILKVNGVSLEHKRANESIDLILGEPGTQVTLTVLHEGESTPVDITLTRAIIEVSTVVGDHRQSDDPKSWDFMLDKENKIGYVRVADFGEQTAGELRSALEQLEAQGVRGLVLDLRGNPGGLLKSAVEIADYFLTKGVIVSTHYRKPEDNETHFAKEEGGYLEPAADHPMAVLVDGFSASASEIVTAALQDHGRAVIVGERSYGKGSVQKIRSIEDGSTALKLTTASYWRPSGKNIHRFPDSKESDDWGVRPDAGCEVKLTDEERRKWLLGRRFRDIIPGKSGVISEKLRDQVGSDPFVDKARDKALEVIREKLAIRKAA